MNADRSVCTCGLGANSFTTSYCAMHAAATDAPEVEVIARALAEWSGGMPWEQRAPSNREHWLRLARVGFAAMKDAHAEWRVVAS